MFSKININYMDIVEKEKVIVNFASKSSDQFSCTALIKRPYSQYPPVFNYGDLLSLYVVKYIFEKKDWPVSFLGKLKHQIMIMCCSCKESRKVLLEMPNLFLPIENNLPEDICFYRNGKPWFATISHEKMAFIFDPTKEDIDFLNKAGIRYNVDDTIAT